MKFKFNFGNADRTKTTIECGYIDVKELVLKYIVKKIGENAAARQSVSDDKLGNRATVFRLQNEPNAIGIVISNIQKNDPTDYRCRALFVDASTQIKEVTSNMKKLVILGKINNHYGLYDMPLQLVTLEKSSHLLKWLGCSLGRRLGPRLKLIYSRCYVF